MINIIGRNLHSQPKKWLQVFNKEINRNSLYVTIVLQLKEKMYWQTNVNHKRILKVHISGILFRYWFKKT